MRFGKPNRRPCLGEHRIIRKFLWLPVTIGGETRWLEMAEIKQFYTGRVSSGYYWKTLSFCNQ